MHTYRLSALFLILAIAATSQAQDETQATRQVAGDYAVTGVTHAGQTLPEETLKSYKAVKFQADKIGMTMGQITVVGSFRIDTSTRPMGIDISMESGPMEGKTFRGLVEMKGAQTTLVLPLMPESPRPRSTESTRENRVTVMTLQKLAEK